MNVTAHDAVLTWLLEVSQKAGGMGAVVSQYYTTQRYARIEFQWRRQWRGILVQWLSTF